MRILLDSNVLLSIGLFPNDRMLRLLGILKEHTIIMPSYIMDELKSVTERKFPKRKHIMERFLADLPYQFSYTPEDMEEGLFSIRDKKDYPVLYTAIREDVDILITGDKDFADVDVEKPEIMTPAEFLDRYCQS